MSYDLLVFDADQAPNTSMDFLDWYDVETEWEEPHSYHDPAVTTPELRAWYHDMVMTFPDFNFLDNLARDGIDYNAVTDYTIGTKLIFASFGFSMAESAYKAVKELALKHRLGFFDPQLGEVFLPDGSKMP